MMANAAILNAFEERPYDVVDASSAEGLWFGVQRRMKRFPHTAYICRSHGLEHLNYQRMLDDCAAGLTSKPWTRRVWYPVSRLTQVALAARLADRLIVLNETDRTFAVGRGWQPEDRIDLIPHGVSDTYMNSERARSRRGGGALFCGSWDIVKGTPYIVEAFTALARAGHPVPLTILGGGLPAHRILAAFREEVRPYVTVIDRVPESEVIAQFRRHDLLVAPSTYEGFGLVIVEAMWQGLPVIATPVGCATTLIRDGVTGRIVPPRDAGALQRAVAALMYSPEERARLGANAAMAVSEMSWRTTAVRTLECYRLALGASPAVAAQ